MASASFRYSVMLIVCCAACAPLATPAAATATLPQPSATGPAAPDSKPSPTPGPAGSAAAPTGTPPPAPHSFTETFDGAVPFWTFRQAGNNQPLAAPSVRDGYLVFGLTAPNQWVYAFYGGPDYGDVTIEAQIQSRTSGDGAAGIVCRYGKESGWYELNVFADGTYQLLFGQWLAETVASYVPLYQGKAQTMQSDENRVALECRGNMLTPVINGQPQRKWQEVKFGLKKGTIGLSVSSFAEAPFSAAFDSVKVSEP